jgi:hypothetical protein
MKLLTRLITLDVIIHLVLLWCYFGQIEYIWITSFSHFFLFISPY